MGILNDHDPVETQEWVDSLRAVLQHAGPERARYLLAKLRDEALAHRHDAAVPGDHALPQHDSRRSRKRSRPGNRELEHKIRSAIRWNAVAIILRANKESSELGGHIASFQSSALLYDIGFGHFWHAPTEDARRRPDLRAGPRVARHLCARVRRRPAHRAAAAQLPPGERGQGHSVVSASVADAGLLAVPDRVDGPRPADGDLPGALPQVPRRPRPRQDRRPQGLGVPGRRRMRRAGIARRDLARRARDVSTT